MVQPVAMGTMSIGSPWRVRGTLDLESATMPNGELAPGAWGKGLVRFDTDHPKARPFLRYPVNHHWAQILERARVATGSGRRRWRARGPDRRGQRGVRPRGRLVVRPFAEATLGSVAKVGEALFDPASFYGGTDVRSLTLGARLDLGGTMHRMGRYGVIDAAPGDGAAAGHDHH